MDIRHDHFSYYNKEKDKSSKICNICDIVYKSTGYDRIQISDHMRPDIDRAYISGQYRSTIYIKPDIDRPYISCRRVRCCSRGREKIVFKIFDTFFYGLSTVSYCCVISEAVVVPVCVECTSLCRVYQSVQSVPAEHSTPQASRLNCDSRTDRVRFI